MLAAAVVVLVGLALVDLWVGVTNDAINFLNSALGAQVARRRVIYAVATLGIVVGALLSDGMMEVARKGIFDPGFFRTDSGGLDTTLILTVYLAVMITDVLLLDFFNTFGLPTSTTVSIVSELLGAAVGVALWSRGQGLVEAFSVINTGPVTRIYAGILMSVAVSFVGGAAVMLLLRTLFTHDLKRGFARFGALWASACMSALLYFVLFSAARHMGLLSVGAKAFIHQAQWGLVLGAFLLTYAAVHVLARTRPEFMLRLIILLGTGALAAAFAGNDLVNFIGPAIAGFQAVFVKGADLSGHVQTPLLGLAVAAAVMALALWRSKKAATVSETEVRLAAHDRVDQRFASWGVARLAVAAGRAAGGAVLQLTPRLLVHQLARRTRRPPPRAGQAAPPYDLLRATVNICVASIIISAGTARQLPLSTTYVTFTVAMGAAWADRCWGTTEGAAQRVTGIMVVVGGWLLTGLMAAVGAFAVATGLTLLGLPLGLLSCAVLLVAASRRLSAAHQQRAGKTPLPGALPSASPHGGMVAMASPEMR